MNVIIHTKKGTYIVPSEYEELLIEWLEKHSIKAGAHNWRSSKYKNDETSSQS